MTKVSEIYLASRGGNTVFIKQRSRKRKFGKNNKKKLGHTNTTEVEEDNDPNTLLFAQAQAQLKAEMKDAGFDFRTLPTSFGSQREKKLKKRLVEEAENNPTIDGTHNQSHIFQKNHVKYDSDGEITQKIFEKMEPPVRISITDEYQDEKDELEGENDVRVLKHIEEKQKESVNVTKMEQITEPEKDNEIWKYWKQRYQLFHKYDEGILLDHEGWFSVTPQAIAEHVAQRCRCNIIVDPFAGCGGNVIQLAQTCNQVIAIDIDPEKIRLARHNARIYGVEHRIEWIVGDSLQILPTLKADVVFLSPPWGGPAYERGNGGFRLKDMMIKDTSGIDLFALARKVSHNIAYFLPKTTSVEEFEALCDEKDAELEVEYAYLNGGMKLITGYYGDLAKRENI